MTAARPATGGGVERPLGRSIGRSATSSRTCGAPACRWSPSRASSTHPITRCCVSASAMDRRTERPATSQPHVRATGQRHGRALLYLFAPSPDHAAHPRDSEYGCNGESGRADRRGGTQRWLFSSKRSRLRGTPSRGRFLRPGNRARARRVTDEPQREKDQRHLQDCAAGRDLHSGDTPRIQHYESFAVSTPQHPGGLGQRGDDMVDSLSFATRIAILVGDINVVTADEPDTKHDRFHVPHTTTPRRRPPGSRVSRDYPIDASGALCARRRPPGLGFQRASGEPQGR